MRNVFQAMTPEQRGAVEALVERTLSGAFFSALAKLDQFPAGTVKHADAQLELRVVEASSGAPIASAFRGHLRSSRSPSHLDRRVQRALRAPQRGLVSARCRAFVSRPVVACSRSRPTSRGSSRAPEATLRDPGTVKLIHSGTLKLIHPFVQWLPAA